MKLLFLGLLILISCSQIFGQSCRPAELNYIVRDESGNVMSETMLKEVFKQMKPPTSGVATVAFASDGRLVGYSGKDPAVTVADIFFVDAKTCQMTVGEVDLTRGSDTMRLIFDLNIDRRAYTVDSVSFRAGTFRLDQKGLADIDQSTVVPAERWKKVKGK